MTKTGYKCRLKVIFAEKKMEDKTFTQGKFADAIGISLGALSSIVNDNSLPSFPVFFAICEQLDMPISEIWVKVDESTDTEA
ncbi:helix-turn-helix transcriptional regulator [Metabacillus litoralis]|uniref:helix-turn-helix transcriptional regulator n=1 Tax=Metabacillus litoralis TaxID=152268 RepID=UPI00203EF4F2|nr:helix-turn-helix transcriptional regulator [Metabacillus litoralis]MCM3651351.1 helix-turn-helix transcriptional regulator [Metabacillus litoralis]